MHIISCTLYASNLMQHFVSDLPATVENVFIASLTNIDLFTFGSSVQK